jgi:hypothetical protein
VVVGIPTTSMEYHAIKKQKLDLLLDEVECSTHDYNTKSNNEMEKVYAICIKD